MSARCHVFVRYPSGQMPATVINKDAHAIVTDKGVAAYLYKNEVYGRRTNMNSVAAMLRKFYLDPGPNDLRRRISLLIEPLTNTEVHNDSSRSRLLYKEGATELPLEEWGEDFMRQMPEDIAALLDAHFKSITTDALTDGIIEEYWKNHYKNAMKARGGRRGKKGKGGKEGKGGGGAGDGKPTRNCWPKTEWVATFSENVAVEYDHKRNIIRLNRNFEEFVDAIERAKMRHRKRNRAFVEEAARKGITISVACNIGANLCRKRKDWWSEDDYRESISDRGLVAAATCGGFALDCCIDDIISKMKKQAVSLVS